MKKFILLTLIWSWIGVVAFGQKKPSGNLFLESESRFGFMETVEKLTSVAMEKSWKVIAIHDLQESLQKNGKEVLPVKVLALCHPKYAGVVLENDEGRLISSMMPCRTSIYEKSNGKTYISRMNPAAFSGSLPAVASNVIRDSFNEVEAMIQTLEKK